MVWFFQSDHYCRKKVKTAGKTKHLILFLLNMANAAGLQSGPGFLLSVMPLPFPFPSPCLAYVWPGKASKVRTISLMSIPADRHKQRWSLDFSGFIPIWWSSAHFISGSPFHVGDYVFLSNCLDFPSFLSCHAWRTAATIHGRDI